MSDLTLNVELDDITPPFRDSDFGCDEARYGDVGRLLRNSDNFSTLSEDLCLSGRGDCGCFSSCISESRLAERGSGEWGVECGSNGEETLLDVDTSMEVIELVGRDT